MATLPEKLETARDKITSMEDAILEVAITMHFNIQAMKRRIDEMERQLPILTAQLSDKMMARYIQRTNFHLLGDVSKPSE